MKIKLQIDADDEVKFKHPNVYNITTNDYINYIIDYGDDYIKFNILNNDFEDENDADINYDNELYEVYDQFSRTISLLSTDGIIELGKNITLVTNRSLLELNYFSGTSRMNMYVKIRSNCGYIKSSKMSNFINYKKCNEYDNDCFDYLFNYNLGPIKGYMGILHDEGYGSGSMHSTTFTFIFPNLSTE